MPMKNPPHPGGFVLRQCIKPNDLSPSQAAKKLGLTKKQLDDFINCRSSVSPKLAIRLAKAFGSTPEGWYKIQMAYDLAQAKKQAHKIKVKRAKPTVTASVALVSAAVTNILEASVALVSAAVTNILEASVALVSATATK